MVFHVVHSGDTIIFYPGQAAHWFNYEKLWPSIEKVLKPGGTVAFWVDFFAQPLSCRFLTNHDITIQGYSEFRVVGHPELTPLIDRYSKGAEALGPYWEQPGRSILDNHLVNIAFPSASTWDASSARRLYFAGEHNSQDIQYQPLEALEHSVISDASQSGQRELRTDVILKKTLAWEGMDSYLRTWSSLHSYHEKYPNDKAKQGQGTRGDIVDRFLGSLQEKVAGSREISIEWPLTLIMIKRAS